MNRVYVKIFTLIGLILFLGALATLFQSANVQANSSGWLSADPELLEYREFDPVKDAPESAMQDCTWQQTQVARVGYPGEFEDKRLCVSQGKSFRFGQEASHGSSYISIGLDRKFYRLSASWSYGQMYHLVGTDTVIIAVHSSNKSKRLVSYDEFHKNITLHPNRQYDLVDWDGDNTLTAGADPLVYGWGISKNGRYLVYGRAPNSTQHNEADYFMIVDNETGEKKMFGKGFYLHLYRPHYPPSFVVSDDGKTVIAAGGGGVKFWNITPECLIDVPLYTNLFPEPCTNRAYHPDFYHDQAPYPESDRLLVDEDFTHIEYIYRPSNYTVKLRIPGYVAPTRLDYLALGDSYSSGEGDIADGPKHYLPGTRGNKECHLSGRSYPFLLRQLWGVNASSMRSVACSGARVAHDYISDIAYYQGQVNQLINIPALEKEKIRKEAIDGFMPGVVPQLEFVKRYKPKIITLTGGGNDVGFADVLRDCASFDSKSLVLPLGTCTYAKHQGTLDLLIGSIRNQYGITKLLINKIRQVSPETKIYIVGYPQFIKRSIKTCLYNDASLNVYERQMLRNMTSELNDVLWRAATDSGAVFIDIEDSLEGGQLCGGGKYMTGVHRLLLSGHSTAYDQRSLFHPNAKGHSQIAKTIFSTVPSVSSVTGSVSRPGAFDGDFYKEIPYYRQHKMINDTLPVNSNVQIATDPHTLKSDSEAQAIAYSDPVSLGSFTVSADGSLRAEITLPESVGMGYHTLVVKGISPSGEPVTLYQFITVTSGIDGDMDGDGIPDMEDRCMFIVEWYDEQSGEDVCKEPTAQYASQQNPESRRDSSKPSLDTLNPSFMGQTRFNKELTEGGSSELLISNPADSKSENNISLEINDSSVEDVKLHKEEGRELIIIASALALIAPVIIYILIKRRRHEK